MRYQLNRAEIRLVAAAAVSRALLSLLQPLYGPVIQSGTPWLSTLAMWRARATTVCSVKATKSRRRGVR